MMLNNKSVNMLRIVLTFNIMTPVTNCQAFLEH